LKNDESFSYKLNLANIAIVHPQGLERVLGEHFARGLQLP
jgi:hypothetical protein